MAVIQNVISNLALEIDILSRFGEISYMWIELIPDENKSTWVSNDLRLSGNMPPVTAANVGST